MMKNESLKKDIDGMILDTANGILQEKIEVLDGCRFLVKLYYKLNSDSTLEIFLPLMGIVSETDEFPLAEDRFVWSTESLGRMDKERDGYLLQVREIIIDTCREIIRSFS